jgi:hypothetical protein
MKLLQVTALALCLNARFTNTMSMNDNSMSIQCAEQNTIATIGAIGATAGAIAAYIASQKNEARQRIIHREYDLERQNSENEPHFDESVSNQDIRPVRTNHEIFEAERLALDIDRFHHGRNDACECAFCCCSIALFFFLDIDHHCK